MGVEQFAADAEEELDKIAAHAPGARVIIRMLVEATEADWPLSRKFGCSRREALRLMDLGRCLGPRRRRHLVPRRARQMREPAMWAMALDAAHALWTEAAEAGHDLRILNIGGGFPAFYGQPMPATEAYAAEVMRMVRHRFGTDVHVMAEPGRGLVAEAGVIVAEVLLVARKDQDDLARWVYLDIGKFSGLAETIDEAIRYQFETRHGDGRDRPLHPRRPVLRLGRRALRAAPGAAAARARGGRQGAHPLHRRLHDELFLGRLQRLPAARRGVPRLNGAGDGKGRRRLHSTEGASLSRVARVAACTCATHAAETVSGLTFRSTLRPIGSYRLAQLFA